MAVCPTYQATGHEAYLARGRLSLVESELDGTLGHTPGLEERIFSCTGCLACESVCPSGLSVHQILLAARARLVSVRNSHRLLRLLARRSFGSYDQMPYAFRLATGTGRAVYAGAAALGLDGGRLALLQALPGAGLEPLASMLPEVSRSPRPGMRVAFFPGCATSLFYPQAGVAAARVLNDAGIEVITPRGLRCCGMPLRSLGDETAARELAEHNLALLSALNVDQIVTTCPSCAVALKEWLPELLGKDRPEVRKTAGLVLDIHQLLHRLSLDGTTLGVAAAPAAAGRRVRVTWHDPCHLRWGLGQFSEPREVIARLPGVKYVESGEHQACCGGAGTFRILQPALSLKIGSARAEEIAASGAELVVTGCPGCRTQLTEMFARQKLNIRVIHTAELLRPEN